jgi:hypothetical protein
LIDVCFYVILFFVYYRYENRCIKNCEMNYEGSTIKDGNNNYWCKRKTCESRIPFYNKSCSLVEDESETIKCYYYEEYETNCIYPCENTNIIKRCVSECVTNFKHVL